MQSNISVIAKVQADELKHHTRFEFPKPFVGNRDEGLLYYMPRGVNSVFSGFNEGTPVYAGITEYHAFSKSDSYET